MCFENQHTFTWGSGTTVDAMPLSLRCECGAMSRQDIDPIGKLQATVDHQAAQIDRLTREIAIAEGVESNLIDDNDRLRATEDRLTEELEDAGAALVSIDLDLTNGELFAAQRGMIKLQTRIARVLAIARAMAASAPPS